MSVAGAGAVPSVDPRSLSATRVLLHHAALLVSAVGRSYAEKEPAFRHAALRWDTERHALRGATFVSSAGNSLHAELRFPSATLAIRPGPDIPLAGRRFDDIVGAIRDRLRAAGLDATQLAMRLPKDLPPGPITTAATMEPNLTAAAALGEWFAFANRHLTEIATRQGLDLPVPCWPDHFDLSVVVLVPPPAPQDAQVGVGFSPGDQSIDEPYCYVTPWPLAATRVAEVPAPAHGRWHVEGWLGLALTASAILAAPDPNLTVAAFLERGLELGRDLLRTA